MYTTPFKIYILYISYEFLRRIKECLGVLLILIDNLSSIAN